MLMCVIIGHIDPSYVDLYNDDVGWAWLEYMLGIDRHEFTDLCQLLQNIL